MLILLSRRRGFALRDCAKLSLQHYERAIASRRSNREGEEEGGWAKAVRVLETEWALWKNLAVAASEAFRPKVPASESQG